MFSGIYGDAIPRCTPQRREATATAGALALMQPIIRRVDGGDTRGRGQAGSALVGRAGGAHIAPRDWVASRARRTPWSNRTGRRRTGAAWSPTSADAGVSCPVSSLLHRVLVTEVGGQLVDQALARESRHLKVSASRPRCLCVPVDAQAVDGDRGISNSVPVSELRRQLVDQALT